MTMPKSEGEGLDDSDIEFKEEHVFENGAVYRGQWRRD
jgi:hypothetical protein